MRATHQIKTFQQMICRALTQVHPVKPLQLFDIKDRTFFTNLLHRSPDMRVTAIYDGGAVQSSEYIAQFAREHGIPQICNSLDELVAQVDGGMVLSQNWDLHLERARPFLLAGKPVFIDKPMVGRLSDLNALLVLAKQTGTPVMGGSTMRFAAELGALRDKVTDLGGVVSAFASGPGDLLNFGAHVVEMITAFFGAHITTVSHIGGNPSHLFRLDQLDGPPIILQLGGGQNGPGNGCVLVLTTQRSVEVSDFAGIIAFLPRRHRPTVIGSVATSGANLFGGGPIASSWGCCCAE
ncbi:hypothetical protein EBZ39_09455 [bacterium]|nr:hypothetical protein [bacterium]